MMRPMQAPPVNPDRMQKPIPGWSLTQPKGKWPWESPPQMTDVNEVVDTVIDKLERPEVQARYVKLMFAGISIEEIVHSISMAGFATGRFSPDVAEIIKGPIGIYMMGLAADYEIPVKVFAKEEKPEELSDGLDEHTLLEIMRQRNPEFYEFMAEYESPEYERAVEMEEKMSQGFLAVEPDEAMLGQAEGMLEDVAEEVLEGEVEGGAEPSEEEEL
jgi:hypothetical protein